MASRYEVTFPMRDGPSRQGVVSNRDLNIILRVWSELVEKGTLPPDLRIEIRTLDASDPRPARPFRLFSPDAFAHGAYLEVVDGSLN